MPVAFSADESHFALEGFSRLSGNVTFQQGDRNFRADEITVWRSPDTGDWEEFIAQGHIHYWSPGLSVFADRADYFHPDRKFTLENATYHWYDRHARGFAESICINADSIITLTQADYSTCAPGQSTWRLSARKIRFNPHSGRATVKHVRFDIADIPIFYFPYFNYPADNKRHSGFLFPTYGSSSNSGFSSVFHTIGILRPTTI